MSIYKLPLLKTSQKNVGPDGGGRFQDMDLDLSAKRAGRDFLTETICVTFDNRMMEFEESTANKQCVCSRHALHPG